MDIAQHLEFLAEQQAVCGAENFCADTLIGLIPEKYKKYARKDQLESLIIKIPGKDSSRQLMILTHYDEPGIVITGHEKGFLAFRTVGGLEASDVAAQEVIISDGSHMLFGVIGTRPPHILKAEERKAPLTEENLRIDLGLTFRDSIPEWIVPGTTAVVRRKATSLAQGKICGRALSDRWGASLLLSLLENIPHLESDLNIVFAAQHYNAFKGAVAAAIAEKPHIALVLDSTTAQSKETPHSPISLANGPVSYSGPAAHPFVTNALRTHAKEKNMQLQLRASGERRFSDIWALQTAAGGIPSALIELPVTYRASSTEIISTNDLNNAFTLISESLPLLDSMTKEGTLYA